VFFIELSSIAVVLDVFHLANYCFGRILLNEFLILNFSLQCENGIVHFKVHRIKLFFLQTWVLHYNIWAVQGNDGYFFN